MKVKIGNNQLTLLLDSGSVCSIVTNDIALSIIDNCKEEEWVTEKRNIKKFSNEPVKTLGTLVAPVGYKNWSATNAHFVIVENGL